MTADNDHLPTQNGYLCQYAGAVRCRFMSGDGSFDDLSSKCLKMPCGSAGTEQRVMQQAGCRITRSWFKSADRRVYVQTKECFTRGLLILVLGLIPTVAGAQELQLKKVATLGKDERGTLLGSLFLNEDSRGRFYTMSRVEPGILVFDSKGNYMQTLGMYGQGPGEYRRPVAMHITGDTLFILDPSNTRVTVISPSYELVRTERLELTGVWPGGYVRLPSKRAVVNAMIRTAELIGLPLHLVDSGRIVKSFGTVDETLLPSNASNHKKPMAYAGGERVWAASQMEYRIDLWDVDSGKSVRTITRDVEWFQPDDVYRDAMLSPDVPPPPRLYQIDVREDGTLWVLFKVANPRWAKNLQRHYNPESGTVYLPANVEGVFDTIVEVLTPRGRLLASERVDPSLRGFTGQRNHAYSFHVAESGLELWDVWELSLDRH
jgi:hypothetical protein